MEAKLTTMIQRLKESKFSAIYGQFKDRTWFIPTLMISLCLLVAIFIDIREKATNTTETKTYQALDTFIPAGFVLVPIEVQNLASLDSLIGQHGVVDLYTPGDSAPLARGVKIVRSPKSPEQFAVLVPETQSAPLIRAGEKPFLVLVQNPGQTHQEIRRSEKPSRIIIDD